MFRNLNSNRYILKKKENPIAKSKHTKAKKQGRPHYQRTLRIINHLGPACLATPQTGFFGFKA
jgi:hypothetical protein